MAQGVPVLSRYPRRNPVSTAFGRLAHDEPARKIASGFAASTSSGLSGPRRPECGPRRCCRRQRSRTAGPTWFSNRCCQAVGAISQLDVGLRLDRPIANAGGYVGELVDVELGKRVGTFLVARRHAKGQRACNMAFRDLRVIVDDHHRDTKRFDLLDLIWQHGECPFGQGDEIGRSDSRRSRLKVLSSVLPTSASSAKTRDRFQVARVDRRPPPSPQRLGKPHDTVPASWASDGGELLVIETDNNALCWCPQHNAAAERIDDVVICSRGTRCQCCGGREQHVASAQAKGSGHGLLPSIGCGIRACPALLRLRRPSLPSPAR